MKVFVLNSGLIKGVGFRLWGLEGFRAYGLMDKGSGLRGITGCMILW